jgi:hypothetical protein
MTLTRRTRASLSFAAVLVVASLIVGPVPAWAEAPGLDGARWSTSAEYLLWWMKDGPQAPTLLSTAGVGEPDFSPVLGSRTYDTGPQSGGRFGVGYRINPDWALEGIGFFLPGASDTRTVQSSGEPGSVRLVVPFFRVENSREARLTIANPGEFYGDARESLVSDMHGVELNVTRRLAGDDRWRLDLLGGFRYLRLRETLSFSASSATIPDPDVFQVTDVFETTNHFYGLQAGIRGEYARDRWFARGTAKVAVGVMRQSIDVGGDFVTNDFNNFQDPQHFVGGFFAQPTNLGQHGRDRFGVVAEAGLKLGYRLTRWASLVVGYTFLYANPVVRPGPQIDRNINTTQALSFQAPETPPPVLTLTGPAQPTVRWRETDVWVQGLTAGVSFAF